MYVDQYCTRVLMAPFLDWSRVVQWLCVCVVGVGTAELLSLVGAVLCHPLNVPTVAVNKSKVRT